MTDRHMKVTSSSWAVIGYFIDDIFLIKYLIHIISESMFIIVGGRYHRRRRVKKQALFPDVATVVLLGLPFPSYELFLVNLNIIQLSIAITTKATDSPADSPINVDTSKNN